MPDFMPYTTEKSMVFQVIESWANGNRATALETLWGLIEMAPVASVKALESTNLNPPENPGGYANAAARRTHVEEDWWGWKQPPPAPGLGDQYDPKQQPYDALTNATTGFWRHWYGNAEAVFRETMIRALALSLGLPRHATRTTHGSGSSASPDGQHWPISIVWKCPCPWYEGWIEFKEYEGSTGNDGHVTVILSTPGHGTKLFDSPVQPGAVVNPDDRAGPEGLWVVSQLTHLMPSNPAERPQARDLNDVAVAALPDSSRSPVGTMGEPTLGVPVRSVGSVVCVAPAIHDGGAKPDGMPFKAPA